MGRPSPRPLRIVDALVELAARERVGAYAVLSVLAESLAPVESLTPVDPHVWELRSNGAAIWFEPVDPHCIALRRVGPGWSLAEITEVDGPQVRRLTFTQASGASTVLDIEHYRVRHS